MTVIKLLPGVALDATFRVRVDGAELPEGIDIGLGLKLDVTPVGTGPVTARVTAPVKLKTDAPVIVMLPEPPCGMVIVGTEGERLKSGVEIASFAILFDPDSATQVLPELSTTTSCGALAAIVHSVNWPLGTPVFEFVAGVTATRELPAGLGGVATRAPGTGANGVTVGEPPPEIVPPLEGSSCAILLAPSSATHGF